VPACIALPEAEADADNEGEEEGDEEEELVFIKKGENGEDLKAENSIPLPLAGSKLIVSIADSKNRASPAVSFPLRLA